MTFGFELYIKITLCNTIKYILDIIRMMNTSSPSSSPRHESITDDQSVKIKEEIKLEKSLLGIKRKKKSDTIGRNFICEKCSSSYLSYPALYTHKKNKHSIIPVTSKNKLFKSSLAIGTKFKYCKEE